MHIKKINLSQLIVDCVVIFFILFGIGRPTWNGYNQILIFTAVLWIALMIPWIIKLTFLKDPGFISYFIFLILYAIFTLFSNDIEMTISYGGTYMIYGIVLIMSTFYLSSNRKRRLKNMTNITLSWIGVLCIFAILYYIQHPGAARLYATHRSDLDGYMIGGGYQLAYICAMLLPVCCRHALKCKLKSWYTLLSILMIILILKSSSMIIILTSLLACIFEYTFLEHGKKRMFVMGVVGSICVILYFFRTNIGQGLIEIAGGRSVTSFSDMNNAVFVRMTEIGMVLKGINVGNSSAMGLRIQNYIRPVSEIVNHPFLGGILKNGMCPESGVFNDSTIITAFSCWGIPIGCLYLFPFISKFKKYRNYKGSIFAVCLTLLLNPSMGFSVVIGAWFLLPALYDLDKEKIE